MTSAIGGTSSIFRRTLVPAAYCKRLTERNFNRRLLAVTAAAILFGGASAARSGPCTVQIEKIEHQIGSDVAGPTFGLTAPQSVDAQLHHQPTPSSVENAKHVANTDGDVAINRALRADAAGDRARCSQDLGAARRFYNIKQ
jgi:hypothetical protein